MTTFLSEAALMADYVRDHSGNVLASIDFLDSHPEYRWTLESLVGSSSGRLYEEVPNLAAGYSTPSHLAQERRWYMYHTKDAQGVNRLLKALGVFYSTSGVTTTAGLKAARKWFDTKTKELGDNSAALKAMTEYFEGLAAQMPDYQSEEIPLGNREIGVKDLNFSLGDTVIAGGYPVAKNYTLQENTKVPDGKEGNESGEPSFTFQRLVHNPNDDAELDWLQRQPMAWKRVFFGVRKAKNLKALPALCKQLREMQQDKKHYSGSQISVLWTVYLAKRDVLRRKQEHNAERNMSKFAEFVLNRILAQTDPREIGRVGACLYAWSKGKEFNGKPMPKTLTSGEWSVLFRNYKQKKEEILAEQAEFDALSV